MRLVDSDKLLKAPVHVDRLKKCINPAERPEQELLDLTDPLPDLQDCDVNDDEFQPLGAAPSNTQNDQENDSNDDKTEYYMVEKTEYYMVEKIIYQRDSNNGKQYFVKWENFPSSHNSWVNESDLNEAFLEFISRNVIPTKPKRGPPKRK